jgi:hypothetical protein
MAHLRTTRREFLKTSATAAAGLALSSCAGPILRGADAPKRPNIVYLMTDDQAWHAMSCAGDPVVRTPNMDRLAREGLRFTSMFVTNSLCAPSRACFLTGKYSHIHGVRNNEVAWRDQPIFTDYLKQAGYHTCFIGKFHQGGKVIPAKPDIWMGFTDQGVYVDQPLRDFDGQVKKEKGHNTDLLGDRAVGLIVNEVPGNQMAYVEETVLPFFERFAALAHDPDAAGGDVGRPAAKHHPAGRIAQGRRTGENLPLMAPALVNPEHKTPVGQWNCRPLCV